MSLPVKQMRFDTDNLRHDRIMERHQPLQALISITWNSVLFLLFRALAFRALGTGFEFDGMKFDL